MGAEAGHGRPKRDWTFGLVGGWMVARLVGALYPDEIRRVHLGT